MQTKLGIITKTGCKDYVWMDHFLKKFYIKGFLYPRIHIAIIKSILKRTRIHIAIIKSILKRNLWKQLGKSP